MTDEECLNMFCEFLVEKSVGECETRGGYPCFVGALSISPKYVVVADMSYDGKPMLELYEKTEAIEFVRESYKTYGPEDGEEFHLSIDEFHEFDWS